MKKTFPCKPDTACSGVRVPFLRQFFPSAPRAPLRKALAKLPASELNYTGSHFLPPTPLPKPSQADMTKMPWVCSPLGHEHFSSVQALQEQWCWRQELCHDCKCRWVLVSTLAGWHLQPCWDFPFLHGRSSPLKCKNLSLWSSLPEGPELSQTAGGEKLLQARTSCNDQSLDFYIFSLKICKWCWVEPNAGK